MKLILWGAIMVSLTTLAQSYKVIDTTDYDKRLALISSLKEKHTITKKLLKKTYKGVIRKELENSYSQLYKSFEKDIRKKELVFNPEFVDYVNSILDEVISKNPELSNDLKIYVSKHNSANALSLLNGYIIMNMGLFKYLDNEAQFVAVVCHEIAHQQLEHMQKNILYKAKQKKDGVFEKQAKEIRRNKYNQYDKAFNVLKKHLFTNSKRHRFHEKQADSLGFELYKNTKYPKQEFLGALKVYAELDSLPEILVKQETYKKYFDLPTASFKNEWLKMEQFNHYNYDHYKEKIDKDSLRTHPEIIDRIDLLEQYNEAIIISEKKNTETTSNYDNSTFKKLQNIAINEDISNLYYLELYGFSTYLTLYKLQKYGGNSYYFNVLSNNFKALYKAKKSYKLNGYVDQIVPKEQDESYQQFLSFIWNLNLSDFKAISDYYREIN